MTDDKFRVWEFKDEKPEDDTIRAVHGLNEGTAGEGDADPSAIDFVWHQRNFEDAVQAIRENRTPLIDGREGRRAVALINAIYRSAAAGGEKMEVI